MSFLSVIDVFYLRSILYEYRNSTRGLSSIYIASSVALNVRQCDGYIPFKNIWKRCFVKRVSVANLFRHFRVGRSVSRCAAQMKASRKPKPTSLSLPWSYLIYTIGSFPWDLWCNSCKWSKTWLRIRAYLGCFIWLTLCRWWILIVRGI